MPVTSTNFDGTSSTGGLPSDSNVAAGSSQVAEVVNTRFAVYDKSGNLKLGPEASNTLFSGFGGGCQTNNNGDATILWDTLAQRWVFQQFVAVSPYLDCVAISQTADATGSWNRYSFAFANFPDYPKMGVWPDAYYASYNLFNGSGTYIGSEVCAFDRTHMLLGASATDQCFTSTSTASTIGDTLPASLDGSTAPPSGEPEWFVGLASTSSLAYYKFHVDWATPSNSTLTGPTSLSVTAFSPACGGGTCIPQAGTTQQLDSLGDRVMFRLAYRNFGDHESLAVTHSVVAGSSVGARWYELRPSSGALTVYQQGTYAPDSAYRWMGSIAMDHVGDMALGYSTSSSSAHPGVALTGRLFNDPLGTMPQGEQSLIVGGGSQLPATCGGGSCGSRWGDYSGMSVDPGNDCTFWYVNQYLPSDGDGNWHTRIGSFSFPGCATGPGQVTNITGTGISNPSGITAGPDGAMWFTNVSNNSIGRVTTGGTVTNYTGTGISSPNLITTGPDGALWFVNDGNNSIGRITTAGAVTNYTGTGISAPAGITAGPDGALWFANAGGSIGRITTGATPAVTNYTGTGISNPLGITAGPDGNLWFTNEANNSIGRITTGATPVVTNYTGTGITNPQGITAGADGALWFANAGNNSIGRITTGGTVTNYTGTGVNVPAWITAGPDGGSWFTNYQGASIGRITPVGPTVSNVAFMGSSATPKIVITGSGFGSAPPYPSYPAGCGTSGQTFGYYLHLQDFSGNTWDAGLKTVTGGTDCIGLVVSSWSDTRIVFGLGNGYNGFYVLNSGDSYAAYVFSTVVSGTVGYFPAPTLAVLPTSGIAGTAVTVTGHWWMPGEKVNVKYKTGLVAPAPTLLMICSVPVASDGSFSCGGHIPSGTNAGPAGAHKISGKGATSGLKASTTFTRT